jgi:Mg/Co/Ni transporter MgtE
VGLLDKDASKVLVKDIFTPPPHLILARPSNSVEECMQRFDEHDVYRLPILDDGADIVGMVSIEDCLRAVLEDNATVDRLAGKDSEPVFGRRSDMIYMSSVEGCLRAVFEEEAAGQRISSGDAEPMAHCV